LNNNYIDIVIKLDGNIGEFAYNLESLEEKLAEIRDNKVT
jgi:hypothetical protein